MFEKVHKFPFIIIDKNKKIIHYSHNFEFLWNEFTKINIRDVAAFLMQKIKNNEVIINLSSNVFYIIVDRDNENWIVSFIDITNISYQLEHYIDIDSFLHEINNPLTVINGIIQILSDKNLDEYTNECLRIISSELYRIKNLLDELKQMRKDSIIKEPIELTEFLDELISSLKIIFPSTIFKVELDPSIKNITGDRQKLFRAFYNIIKNACEAKKNSVINLSIFIESSVKYYDKFRNMYLNMVKFNISDFGGGINDSIREKIFTPFFSTKSKGLGLGLAISRQIIENHNGKIEFKSTKDIGTTFSVLLPL
jgi:nitrogen-specific signal transduction histidine kinase